MRIQIKKTLEQTMKKLSLLVLAAMTAAGCAQGVGDLNRVQPDAYPKAYFTGEWYMRPTIIRTQYNQALLFEGLEGTMDRVTWEVQEKQLIAWRSYEYIPNSEANPGKHTPMAIFGIQSHFDIKRDYNPSNGQESNIIIENTTDRPWYEREYFRVDWSRNMVPDYDIGGFVTYYSELSFGINQTQDRYEEVRPRIGPEYIDVVTRAHLLPDYDMLYLDYSLYETSEADIRWSFRKLDPNNDYEPLLYPDFLPVKIKYRYARFDRIDQSYSPCAPSAGDSTCALYSGAPSSGKVDACASASETATANWNNTVLCNPETSTADDCFCMSDVVNLYVDGNGNICDTRIGRTPDPEDCTQVTYPIFERFGFFRTLRMPFDWERNFTFNSRIYLANRWNIWQRSKDDNGAMIPYDQRSPRPIVYYTNPHFPEDLMPEAQRIADDWNDAFLETVADLQGKTKEQVTEALPAPRKMYELRRNSCSINNVKGYAEAHGLQWVLDKAVGGIERVELGNLTRACTALEWETREADDRFEWQRMGDLRYSFMFWVHTPQQAGPLGYGPSAADPVTGEIVNANAYIYGAGVDTYANFAADMVQLLNGEVPPNEFADGDNVIAEITAGRARVNEGLSKRSTRQLMQRFADVDSADPGGYLTRLPSRDDINAADPRSVVALADQNARMKSLEPFAMQHLVDEDMLRAFAGPERYQPGQMPDLSSVKLASPTTWGRYPDLQRRMDKVELQRRTSQADRRTLDEEMDVGVLDREARLERFFAEKTVEFGSMLVEPAVYGLAQRLKGKTRAQVVQHARKEIFRGVEAHEVGHTLGLRHNFAGSADALNFHESFWRPNNEDATYTKWDYAYSSIMDYHQRFNSDWAGIGPYDKAAIKFGYGQLMEVFDETDGEFVPDVYFDFARDVLDYKDLPKVLGGSDIDDNFEQAYFDAISGHTQVLTLPATVSGNVDNLFKRRNERFSNVWDDYLKDLFGGWENGQYTGSYSNKLHSVPYQFCSDAYAWGGNLQCNRYDMGANIDEVVQHASDMYDAYYLFNNFRRDRYTWLGGPMSFRVGGYLTRLYDRTYQPMLNSFRYFYYYRRSLLMMYPLVQDWATGALNGLNFFAGVLQKPEPGNYCLKLGEYTYLGQTQRNTDGCDDPNVINIPVGEGRYFGTRWTDEYYYKPTRIGSYWDKWLAMNALTDSQFFLVRNFSSLFDRGAFSITYYRVFEREMTELFRAMMDGNLSSFQAGVQLDSATGQYRVVPRPLVAAEGAAQAPSTPRIKASLNWSLQKQSALMAAVGFTSSVDRKLDFGRRMRITYEGAADDPLYEGFQDSEIARFTDPATHLTYRAAPVGGLDSPGYVMVAKARDFHTQAWTPAKQALGSAEAALEQARQGNNQAAIDAAEAAVAEAGTVFGGADRNLRQMVDLLEYTRILGYYMHLYWD